MESNPPRGLIIELVNPLLEDGDFDREGFRRLLARAIRGSDAVFINGLSAGEALWIPRETRKEIVSEAISAWSGAKPLLIGITGFNEEETVSNIGAVEEADIGGRRGGVFLVDAPLCYRGNRNLSEHYLRFSRLTSLPFILLNDPVAVSGSGRRFRRRNIRTNVLKKVSVHGTVTGAAHKGSIARALNYAKAVRHRPGFLCYDADETNFLDSPGGDGLISAGANIFPEKWRQIVMSSSGLDEKEKKNGNYRQRLLRERENLKILHAAYRPFPAPLIKASLKAMGLLQSDMVFGKTGVPCESKRKICLLTENISECSGLDKCL